MTKINIDKYRGIITFAIVLLLAHFLWKILVVGEDSDQVVTLFGLDISAPFKFMVAHIAKVCTALINFSGFDATLVNTNRIIFKNGNYIYIIWGCTAIKQSYIFICIMLFTRGCNINKLWFIPAGLTVIYVFNILRISAIAIIEKYQPEMFVFFHQYIFKTLFYIVIFLMWVLWEEKFAVRKV